LITLGWISIGSSEDQERFQIERIHINCAEWCAIMEDTIMPISIVEEDRGGLCSMILMLERLAIVG